MQSFAARSTRFVGQTLTTSSGSLSSSEVQIVQELTDITDKWLNSVFLRNKANGPESKPHVHTEGSNRGGIRATVVRFQKYTLRLSYSKEVHK